MNQTYIFSKETRNENLFYLAVAPLFIYGIYKNGYLLYTNKYINLFEVFKVAMYPLISILIGYLIGLIFKNKKSELLKFGVLAGLVAPFDFNMIAYFSICIGMMFVVALVPNHLKINNIAFLCTILIILNKVFNNSIIFNPMEITNMYKFTLFDLFFGRGASFLYTSSVFWLLISYVILSFIKTYKKNIFIISSITFIVFSFIYMFITKSYLNNLILLLNGTSFFSFIFIAPINESSPSISNEITIYSILVGLISFILVFIFKVYTGAIITVFALSIIYRIYNIIRQKIFLKHT